ncbi:hypothetical protein DIPPA_12757, partial [Diplonema papillatum]
IRKMIKAFAKFKREYASFRPNRDMLKAMLRADPERRGAERIRDLIDGKEVSVDKEKESLKVIMGGMRVPELKSKTGAPPRLFAEKKDANGDFNNETSVAEAVPYTTESASKGGVPLTNKPVVKAKRSRSSPRLSSASAADEIPSLSGSMKDKKGKTPRTSRVVKPQTSNLGSSTKRVATARASTARAQS